MWDEIAHCLIEFEMHKGGCTTLFKMHDLVHDLAQSVSEGERQIMGTESSSIVPKKTRMPRILADVRTRGSSSMFPLATRQA